MIIYQLPNGKIIRLTIEEYLDLTDEDISYLISIDYGECSSNPWLESSLPKSVKEEFYEEPGDVIPPDMFLEDGINDI